jgi:hypothetical protein
MTNLSSRLISSLILYHFPRVAQASSDFSQFEDEFVEIGDTAENSAAPSNSSAKSASTAALLSSSEDKPKAKRLTTGQSSSHRSDEKDKEITGNCAVSDSALNLVVFPNDAAKLLYEHEAILQQPSRELIKEVEQNYKDKEGLATNEAVRITGFGSANLLRPADSAAVSGRSNGSYGAEKGFVDFEAIIEGSMEIQKQQLLRPATDSSTAILTPSNEEKWKKKYCLFSADGVLRMQESREAITSGGNWKQIKIFYSLYDTKQDQFASNTHSCASKNEFRISPRIKYYYFTLYAVDRIYFCRVSSQAEARNWQQRVFQTIEPHFKPKEWQTKAESAEIIYPLLRQLRDYEHRKFLYGMIRIAAAGLVAGHVSSSLTGNLKSSISANLGIYDADREKWQESYCLIAEKQFIWFKSSKAREPQGVINLRNSTFSVDSPSLRRGVFIFTLKNEFNRVSVRCKHLIVLCEWAFAVEKAIQGTKSALHSSSEQVLSSLLELFSNVDDFAAILQHSKGFEAAREFIKAPNDFNSLLLWKDLQYFLHYYAISREEKDKLQLSIIQRLKAIENSGNNAAPAEEKQPGEESSSEEDSEGEEKNPQSPKSSNSSAVLPANSADLSLENLLSVERNIAAALSTKYFTSFTESGPFKIFLNKLGKVKKRISEGKTGELIVIPSAFAELKQNYEQTLHNKAENDKYSVEYTQTLHDIERGQFSPSNFKLVMTYLRKEKTLKKAKVKTKTYYFDQLPGKSKEKSFITIGRGSNNDMAVNDSGVSRNHAKFEWDKRGIFYMDLGSTYGSLLNGASTIKAKLQEGDEISIGKHVKIVVEQCTAEDDKNRSKAKCVVM